MIAMATQLTLYVAISLVALALVVVTIASEGKERGSFHHLTCC